MVLFTVRSSIPATNSTTTKKISITTATALAVSGLICADVIGIIDHLIVHDTVNCR
jgi:hypothetical protein